MARVGCAAFSVLGARYFDRSPIGTGLQQLNSHSMTDLDLQVRLKL